MATSDSPTPDARAHDHADHEHGDHVHEPDRELAVPAWRVLPETEPQRSPAVVEVEVDGHLIIAHATSMRVVRLDPINALLWRSFGPGVTVGDLAEDLVDGLGVDPLAALEMLTFTVTDLARAGFLTEPADPPNVRRPRFWTIEPESDQGRRLGLDRMGPEHTFVIDLGPGLLRPATTDLEISTWLRARFAEVVVAPDDPRTDDEIEMMLGATGAPAAHRRQRHRSADHYGGVWFSTFDRAEHADALARGLRNRLDAAEGGTWLRLAALVADVPVQADVPTPAVLIHPWGLPTIERLLPGLRRAGVAVHPSALLRYDPATSLINIAPSPRFPSATDMSEASQLRPVLLAGAATDDGLLGDDDVMADLWSTDSAPAELTTAELVERFGHAALHFDRAHLDAIAHLVISTPYRTVDAGSGLRTTVEALAALVVA